ncbi:MAG: DUF4185 domain-containing protein [Gemmatimonadota bacterium]
MGRREGAQRALRAALTAAAAAGGLSGCVVSIAPIVPPAQSIVVPGMEGTWLSEDGDRATVSRADSGIYTIEFVESDGRRERYLARAGRLAGRTVLDVWSAPAQHGPGGIAREYPGTMIPGHLLLVLELSRGAPGTARLSVLERDSLAAALRSGAVRVPFLDVADGPVLTADTDSLRAFLADYLDRPGALSEPDRWRRSDRVEAAPVEPPCFEASPWAAADSLFHRDPHWVGADDAYSVALGGDRTLWLFADTWIDPGGRRQRRGGRMIRNSLAIQTGLDPSTAAITFHWRRNDDGEPASFFAEDGADWFWPGDGVRLGGRLILFLMRVRHQAGGLGFQVHGWDVVLVENPDAEPSRWRMRWLDAPANDLGVIVGSAGVLIHGDSLYAFGGQETNTTHPMYLTRWPVASVRRGDLSSMEWWGGREAGWVSDASTATRWPAFLNGGTELTVHHDDVSGRFLVVQTLGFGAADIALRAAPAIEGPWSPRRAIYRPPEYHRPGIMIYAAKAHPELTGADLVLTYATNLFDFAAQVGDPHVYFPRFVRLTRCR